MRSKVMLPCLRTYLTAVLLVQLLFTAAPTSQVGAAAVSGRPEKLSSRPGSTSHEKLPFTVDQQYQANVSTDSADGKASRSGAVKEFHRDEPKQFSHQYEQSEPSGSVLLPAGQKQRLQSSNLLPGAERRGSDDRTSPSPIPWLGTDIGGTTIPSNSHGHRTSSAAVVLPVTPLTPAGNGAEEIPGSVKFPTWTAATAGPLCLVSVSTHEKTGLSTSTPSRLDHSTQTIPPTLPDAATGQHGGLGIITHSIFRQPMKDCPPGYMLDFNNECVRALSFQG